MVEKVKKALKISPFGSWYNHTVRKGPEDTSAPLYLHIQAAVRPTVV